MPKWKGGPEVRTPASSHQLPIRTLLYNLNIMLTTQDGAIAARAVEKKYYPQGGDFFVYQAERTLAPLASAGL